MTVVVSSMLAFLLGVGWGLLFCLFYLFISVLFSFSFSLCLSLSLSPSLPFLPFPTILVVAAVKPKAGSIWAKAATKKTDSWNCSSCLSENNADLDVCGACGAGRDGKMKAAPAAAPVFLAWA